MASVVVVALAFVAMWLWFREPPQAPPPRTTDNGDPVTHEDPDTGMQWVEATLAERRALDPQALWPRQGMRVSHPEVWVIWQSAEKSPGRLLARSERSVWYDLGRTHAFIHYLPLDLSKFGSEASFMVEFEDYAQEWRSEARKISFGAGVHFARRRVRFTVEGQGEERFRLQLRGGDPTRLGAEAFRTTLFPSQLVPFVVPISGDADGGEVDFCVLEVGLIGERGAIGFLEVFDTSAHTYDRILIELVRR